MITPRRVLVVDDDAEFLETVTMVLEDAGIETVSASTGGEALEKLHEGLRPDVILLDLMMPGMNGWVLRQSLAQDPALAHIPVCVLSGDHEALRKSPPPDVARCLRKPLSLATLLEAVADSNTKEAPGA